jgi:hypothetical protein
MRRTTCITALLTAALASLAIAQVANAKSRHPVTRAEAFAAAQRQAERSAARLEKDGNGTVSIDRSRTSVGNYNPYDPFRRSASFVIFGTNTVNGEAGLLWCVGNVEVRRTKKDHTRVLRDLTCVGD